MRWEERLGLIFIDETLSSQSAALSGYHTAVRADRPQNSDSPQHGPSIIYELHWKQAANNRAAQRGLGINVWSAK